jgi:hypothetical protein
MHQGMVRGNDVARSAGFSLRRRSSASSSPRCWPASADGSSVAAVRSYCAANGTRMAEGCCVPSTHTADGVGLPIGGPTFFIARRSVQICAITRWGACQNSPLPRPSSWSSMA